MKKDIIYYDFDDTLIPGDSILYWKRFYFKKRPKMRIFQLLSLIGILGFILRFINSETLKKIFLIPICYESRDSLESLAKDFVQEELIPRLYEDVLDQLTRQCEESNKVVIISASPYFYLKHLSKHLVGVKIVGTKLEFPNKGLFRYPKFSSKWGNMKGQNKVNFILSDEIANYTGSRTYGYSDSTADLPLLNFVDIPTVINPDQKLRKKALKNKWKIMMPKDAPSSFESNFMKILTLILDAGYWPKKSNFKL